MPLQMMCLWMVSARRMPRLRRYSRRSISLLEKSGSIEYARSRAEEMVEKGKRALQVLPDSNARATLLELADFMIRRIY